jgi:dihydropteroate synthase
MSRAYQAELVGIINITPDSFSDGGLYDNPVDAVIRADELIAQGVAFIDVGAEATNPYVTPVDAEEEWLRLASVATVLLAAFPGKISIDTYHPQTARRAAKIGEVIINDVTTFHNPEMIRVAQETGARCIASHLPFRVHGDIQRAHREIDKLENSVETVKKELLTRRGEMIKAGVDPSKIILDPGIGFGKTTELNWKLLEFAAEVPGIDVMIGFSRKRFLGEEHRREDGPNRDAANRAMRAGARYLRVHEPELYAGLLH